MGGDLIGQLLGVGASDLLVTVGALLARIAPVIWLAPFLGGKLVPATVKPVLALALGALLFPQVAPAAIELASAGPVVVAAVLAKEVLVGLTLGFVASLVFLGAQSAGWLIDTARGANLAEALVPQIGQRSSPLGSLKFQLAIVLFIALGGHRMFITSLGASYEVLPLLRFPSIEGLGAFASLCGRLTADLVLLALSLAAPVVAALVLTDLALGWVNRFAPQINVFFLAMPLKALLGLAALVLVLSLIFGALPPLMDVAVQQVDWALRLLAGA